MKRRQITNNLVKKHMETFHKPKTHTDKTQYRRRAKYSKISDQW